MTQMQKPKGVDLVSCREAYLWLAKAIDCGAQVRLVGGSVMLSRVSPSLRKTLDSDLRGMETEVSELLAGYGEKKAMSGRNEVLMACHQDVSSDGDLCLSVTLLLVRARGPIVDSLTVKSSDPNWLDDIQAFVDWGSVSEVLCAVDGNNQRAAIGMVLSLTQIGRGKLEMIEANLPSEEDESSHLVKGAVWFRAGLPRFLSSASEALWYLIRVRGLHARMFETKKQGLYTALAVKSLFASGIDHSRIATLFDAPRTMIEKMSENSVFKTLRPEDMTFLENEIFGEGFSHVLEETQRLDCARTIWAGSAMYSRGLRHRLDVSKKVRKALSEGSDLLLVAKDHHMERRRVVQILSTSLEDLKNEELRFVQGVLKPKWIEGVCSDL